MGGVCLLRLPSVANADSPQWITSPGSGAFAVEAETITTTRQAGQGEATLQARAEVQDFILEFEFRQEPGAPAAAIDFRGRYRLMLSGTGLAGPGALSEPGDRGWLYPLTLNPAAQTAAHPNEWNRFRLEAVGASIRTWVNGQPAASIVDDAAAKGALTLWLGPARETSGKSTWRAFNLQVASKPAATSAQDPFIRNFLLNQLSGAERLQGWQLLWDGHSTAGWRGAHRVGFPSGGWRMQAGELILSSTPEGEKRPGGDLVTTETFSAFEFQFDFLLTPGANSGVKYFVTEDFKPTSGITAIGLEFQLLDDALHPDAQRGTDGNRKLGSLYDIFPATPPPAEPGLTPVIGRWQHARIVVFPDQRAEHWLNGIKIVDYVRGSPAFLEAVARSAYAKFPRFGQAEAGRLLLQDHGNEVHFRNLKVRRLAP